ncbi:YtpI family protein [Fictibacillus sp. Mic-4]|uniref:YtpI family protein n=1 Tax=Fictibacillus TaxID=1329200 RepID=UPI0004264C73|nr:YtpI family protein [Fictibacillus gelatini]
MPVFVILIVISFSLYIFFKAKEFRTKAPFEKRWVGSKGKIALGCFLFSFGLNQLSMLEGRIQLWVAIIFSLYGLVMMIFGYKMYRHLLPLAIEEATKAKS